MALPNDDDLQITLLHLLAKAPEGQMHCRDVYEKLAKQFPRLTKDELTVPYRRSISHWANRVQWARDHLARRGLVLRPAAGNGRGYWTISVAGRKHLRDAEAALEELGR